MQMFLKGFLYMIFFLVAITLIAALMLLPGSSNNRSEQSINIKINNENSENSSSSADNSAVNVSTSNREEVLKKAKEMVEVKWTPSNNLAGWDNSYIFKAGVTYMGIPYSMGLKQATSSSDFLEHFKNGPELYGNDCSGFVSTAWGISRQTTFTLYKAVKSGSKIDGKTIEAIPWDDLKPGDALLRENGNGKGHIVLFVSRDLKDTDKLNVYEQNIPTTVPYQPFPTAREDVRSEKTMTQEGYFPIRLSSLK